MADKNHEMWNALGMDLETHDQLCAVLPTAFGDVFLTQDNIPAGMDYFYTVAGDIHGLRPAELIEAQKAGKKFSVPSASLFPMKSSLRQTESSPVSAEAPSFGCRKEKPFFPSTHVH